MESPDTRFAALGADRIAYQVRGEGPPDSIAVHIAARVVAHAGPGEVIVSRTVRDLVTGAGFSFATRGTHELKGVPDPWELCTAAEGSAAL